MLYIKLLVVLKVTIASHVIALKKSEVKMDDERNGLKTSKFSFTRIL